MNPLKWWWNFVTTNNRLPKDHIINYGCFLAPFVVLWIVFRYLLAKLLAWLLM